MSLMTKKNELQAINRAGGNSVQTKVINEEIDETNA